MACLMQTEQQTQERQIVNPRRGRFDTEKSSGARTPTWNSTVQATKMETAATNSGAERTSLNEFRMLMFFKSKWKRFWIISLINIWANITVTKTRFACRQVYTSYCPRLLGFHSLLANAMKCIYVGFSMSKLQSFLWKISLNSCLIRLEGFNNKISTILHDMSVPRGIVVKLSPGASKVPSSNLSRTLFSSLFFFSFLLFFVFLFVWSSF